MSIPTHLQHKPIIAVDNYDTIDGHFAPKSDAKSLSIGQAQYDKNEISAKVFRHTGKIWSPQSEELPIHRVLDLAIFVLSTMANSGSSPNLKEKIVEPTRHKEVLDYYKKHKKMLDPKLAELKKLLNSLI